MSQYNLSQVRHFLSEFDGNESDLDDSVIDSTFTDLHDGSTREEGKEMLTDESDDDDDDNSDAGVDATQNQSQVDPADLQYASLSIVWKEVSSFIPKFTPSAERSCKITHDLTMKSSIYDIFLKI